MNERTVEAIVKARQYVAMAQRMFNERDYSISFYKDQLELAEALLAVIGDPTKYSASLAAAQETLNRAHMTHYDQKHLVGVIRGLVKLVMGEQFLLDHFRGIIGREQTWAGAILEHSEVAGMVRMLTRDQLDHEMVCTAARDRIIWLADQLHDRQTEVAAAQAKCLTVGTELHSMKYMFKQLMDALGALSGPEDKFECIAEGPERDELAGLYRRWTVKPAAEGGDHEPS